MKATTLLERQHRKLQTLLKKLERDKDKKAVLMELSVNLAGHMAIEQEIFYPALREIDEERMLESFEEHALAEIELKRLLHTEAKDESFAARASALREVIEHHLQEEEQGIFPEVEEAMDEERLEELAEEMRARFDEVLESGPDAVIPQGLDETSSDRALTEIGGSAPTRSDSARPTSRGRGARQPAGRAASRPSSGRRARQRRR